MYEHTPGPWRVHESKLGTVLSPKDETVALVGGDVEGSPTANARLIAQAPALLEALKDAAYHHIDNLAARRRAIEVIKAATE